MLYFNLLAHILKQQKCTIIKRFWRKTFYRVKYSFQLNNYLNKNIQKTVFSCLRPCQKYRLSHKQLGENALLVTSHDYSICQVHSLTEHTLKYFSVRFSILAVFMIPVMSYFVAEVVLLHAEQSLSMSPSLSGFDNSGDTEMTQQLAVHQRSRPTIRLE